MPESKTKAEETVRPTKKQRELLEFIRTFIAEHGYSPSYREIMNSLNYTSVATVSLHVNNLIKRGHLRKREHEARSLEVVDAPEPATLTTNQIKAADEKWLVDKIDHYFNQVEQGSNPAQGDIDALYVLVGTLKVLGLEGAAQSFMPRLSTLKKRYTK